MEILYWLAVPLAVTVVATLWAAWAGRPRDASRSDERAQERFARAMTSRRRSSRPLLVARQPDERPTGVAVRPSRRGGSRC